MMNGRVKNSISLVKQVKSRRFNWTASFDVKCFKKSELHFLFEHDWISLCPIVYFKL